MLGHGSTGVLQRDNIRTRRLLQTFIDLYVEQHPRSPAGQSNDDRVIHYVQRLLERCDCHSRFQYKVTLNKDYHPIIVKHVVLQR
jgi:hypothetical protein